MKRLFYEATQIFIGIILASIGLKMFLLPNGFLDGGVTGIAILLGEVFDVSVSYTLFIVSIPFVILAWIYLNKRIAIKSAISIIGLAIFIQFENFTIITEDKLLIAIFGGLFLGAGIGLTIRNGAALDGTEILGIFINNRLGISIGKVILTFNVVLFSVTAIVLSLEVAMYSVLTFLVTVKVIDQIIHGFEDYVGLMITSEKHEEIEAEFNAILGIGSTVYVNTRGHGKKGSQEGNNVIHTVVNRIEIAKTYKIIDSIDSNAFIIEFDVHSIKGGKLSRYSTRDVINKLNPVSMIKNEKM